jgi:plastocyanin
MPRRRVVGITVVVFLGILVLTQLPGSPLRISGPGGQLGTLEGVVRLAGDAHVLPTPVANTTDPDVCGRTQSLEDLLVDAETRGVANAVATLVDIPDSVRRAPPTPQRLLIDNRGCRFLPHVSVAALGDTLVSVNSDPVFHTTHYYGPLESNVALTEPGQSVPNVVDQVGVITILCDLHGWMKGFIRVDDHRFHDVSDERGRFRIRGIPPGDYTAEIWHERLGTQGIPVEIEAGRTTRVDIELAIPESAVR